MAFLERTTRDMVLMLTALLSHRALRSRRDQLNQVLRPDEQNRLAELDRVFGTADVDSAGGGERPAFLLRLEGRAPVRLPVEYRVEPGEWREAALSNLSSSGFFVEIEAPRPIGELVVFKFLDLAAGRAWQFAGEVEWVAGGAGGGMGLRFTGIPLELRLGHAGPRSRRLPIAA